MITVIIYYFLRGETMREKRAFIFFLHCMSMSCLTMCNFNIFIFIYFTFDRILKNSLDTAFSHFFLNILIMRTLAELIIGPHAQYSLLL